MNLRPLASLSLQTCDLRKRVDSRQPTKIPISADEESHLDARQLDDVVVGELARLLADRRAVDQRKLILVLVVDADDEIAFRTARDGGHLYARAAQCRQCLGELELAPGKGTRQHLQF